MSHSTTVTTTHILAKYSKSYPQTGSASASDPNANTDAEWQHFANPVIRLLLDIKKSLKGELESVRLRILWSMNAGDDSMDVDQRDVGFEDLDLLAFSPLSSFKPQQRQQSQCLPLKAVYRDAVVGIRYLHPRIVAVGCRPVYRRFQITFMSTTAASQFIDAIRNVCPCKANSTPARNVTTNTQKPNRRLNSIAFTPSHLPLLETPARSPGTPLEMLSSPSFTQPSSQIDTSSILHSPRNCDSHSRPSTSSSTVPSCLPNNEAVHQTSNDGLRRTGPCDEAVMAIQTCKKSSFPNSSPSSSLNSSQSMMLPPPLPLTVTQALPQVASPLDPNPGPSTEITSSHDLFIASLRETPTLYNLPHAELEKLVGEVVREEGFAKLLETLDSMWKVKGFLGR